MSYYIVGIFREQVIFACDRRIIKWKKNQGKVEIEKSDTPEEKYSQINPFTYFLGPTNGALDGFLTDFLKKEFGDDAINLEKLAKWRFDFQRKGQEVIKKAETFTREWLSKEGLTEEDIGGPNIWKVDSYICGVDAWGRQYLIDFKQGFEFQIYTDPGTCGVCKHNSQINRWVAKSVRDFRFVTNNRLLYRLPKNFVREFQQRFTAWAFPRIIKFVAERDFRVGKLCDVIKIDRNGSEILRPRKNFWTD